MHIRDGNDGDELTLNLTPMIDVVFLLLIFFMVATTFLEPEKQLEIDLPRAESGGSADEERDEIVINVTSDGRVLLSGEEVDESGLRTALRSAADRDPATAVTIRGDRAARHESIVGVMDACGSAGLFNLSVGTLEEG